MFVRLFSIKSIVVNLWVTLFESPRRDSLSHQIFYGELMVGN